MKSSLSCPKCQAPMEPGEVSFRQSGASWFVFGPAAMELQFIDAKTRHPVDLGISNNAPPVEGAPDSRCRSCGLIVILPRT